MTRTFKQILFLIAGILSLAHSEARASGPFSFVGQAKLSEAFLTCRYAAKLAREGAANLCIDRGEMLVTESLILSDCTTSRKTYYYSVEVKFLCRAP